jgi:hypothetical protein
VENISDSKVRYSVKFWDAEKEEPPGWDFHAIELNSRKERGSACLIAHNTEVTFGDIHVRPVENSLPLEDIKPRLLITTDIGGDPDDTQSLIRLLVTSSEFDLEGIITSASGTPGELDTFVIRPDLVLDLIDSYDSVYGNLSIHHSGFPEPAYLRGIVKCGNFMRGLDYIGKGRDTEGSRWIEERILAEDDRPLNICIWGGQTDLFQALFSLKNSLSLDDFKDVTSRIRIYNISDQDRIHQHFKSAFPELFHILAKSPPGMDKREGTYRGMYLGGDESLTSRDWIYTHVKEGHGPLGALYPDRTWTAPNRHACLKEGDTPSWFYFLNNGLQEPDRPGWGGWGGRFRVSTAAYFRDAHDCIDTICSARASVWRWRKAFQNDFAARMDWCVHSYEEANHHPVAEVNGDRTRKILCYSLKDKDEIWLDAGGSFDPDNQPLDFRWWIYAEPSGLERPPEIKHGNAACIKVDPEWLGEREKIHLVLEVSDRGNPSLTSYRRILVTSYRKCIFGRAQ